MWSSHGYSCCRIWGTFLVALCKASFFWLDKGFAHIDMVWLYWLWGIYRSVQFRWATFGAISSLNRNGTSSIQMVIRYEYCSMFSRFSLILFYWLLLKLSIISSMKWRFIFSQKKRQRKDSVKFSKLIVDFRVLHTMWILVG